MVSFWPWMRDDNSPASFEKTLASLSGKINKAAGDLEDKRQGLRRFKGLWTLSSILVYLIYLMIAALAIGWRNWGAVEYTIAAAGPVVIYIVRLGVTAFYEFRISSSQERLKALQKQRDATVAKLKEATKYNTTLQLLEKYGGGPTKSKPKAEGTRKPPSKETTGATARGKFTGIVPPPTANIPGLRGPSSATGTPDKSAPFSPPPNPPHTAGPSTSNWRPTPSSPGVNAEFAPNAFNHAPQYVMGSNSSSWYDRFMNVLLGEDEMHPKNRLALICENCRLVNGQAPPGAKTLEAVGKWRCSNCGTMNGVDPVIDTIATTHHESPLPEDIPTADAADQPANGEHEDAVPVDHGRDDKGSDITQYSDEEETRSNDAGAGGTAISSTKPGPAESEGTPRRSARGKRKA